MKIVNFLPFSLAIIYLIILELILNASQTQYSFLFNSGLSYLGVFGVLLIFLVILNTITAFLMTPKDQYSTAINFAILPITASWSVLMYVVILNNLWLLQISAVLLVMLIYFYWRFVFFYFYNHKRYTSFSLDNLSFYVNFLIIFLTGAAALGLRLLLALNIWMPLVLVAMVSAVVVYQQGWVSKYGKDKWFLLLGGWLVLVQVFIAILFLPHNHQLLGFVWATVYYLVITLINDYLKKVKFFCLLSLHKKH